jgi:hypothetical protein
MIDDKTEGESWRLRAHNLTIKGGRDQPLSVTLLSSNIP